MNFSCTILVEDLKYILEQRVFPHFQGFVVL